MAILRRHLLEKVAVSDLCDELDLAPTVFYRWQKEFFENGAAAFERRSKGKHKEVSQQQAHRMEALQAKLATKNEVLSELMEEPVKLKSLFIRMCGFFRVQVVGPGYGIGPVLVHCSF